MKSINSLRNGSVSSSMPRSSRMGTWMKGTFGMLFRTISKGIRNVISSLGLGDGAMHSDLQDGRMTDQCGQVVVLVNLSARQAQERGLLTSGTYGPRGSISCESENLQLSLVSRLKLRLGMGGSSLFKLTWKEKVTNSGLSVFLLRARGLLIREPGCTSGRPKAPWSTPTTREWKDSGDLSGSFVRKDGKIRNDTVARQAFGMKIDGHGEDAGTERTVQLTTNHSRWLMGYPEEWESCADMVMPSSRR